MNSRSRDSFEKWISSSPYGRDIHRWPDNEVTYAWPGQYRDSAVQLAWEAWLASREALTEPT